MLSDTHAFHFRRTLLTPRSCVEYFYDGWMHFRGDSRVSGYPGLSPKIQDLLLLHIDDWPVYMKFIIKFICQSEVSYELQWAVPDGSKLRFVILMRMKTQWWWCVQGMVIKTFGAFLKTFGASATLSTWCTLLDFKISTPIHCHCKAWKSKYIVY